MFQTQKLQVYQRALGFAARSQALIDSLTRETSIRDQLERCGDSVALNIAEGNGKFPRQDRARFFQIPPGPALESAACLDLLGARNCCEPGVIEKGKQLFEEVVRMLYQLGCRIAEDAPVYAEGVEED